MFEWFKIWLEQRKKSVMFEAAIIVTDSNGDISSTYPDGTIQTIGWSEIESVEVHTNDSGPWGADVWWILRGQDSLCSYPQGATGEVELLSKLQSLPSFNDNKLIEAMGCTNNEEFICWQKAKVI